MCAPDVAFENRIKKVSLYMEEVFDGTASQHNRVLDNSWCSNENRAFFTILIDKFQSASTKHSFVLLDLYT